MLKYSFLLFVLAVAVSWSKAETAPTGIWISRDHNRDGTRVGAITKRDTEDEQKLLKQLSAGQLLLTVESSSERDALEDMFAAAIEKKWNSIDDYANHLVKVYQEVTGRLPGEGIDSDELLSQAIQFER